MKSRNVLAGIIILTSIMVFSVGYNQGWAQARQKINPAKIGVFDLRSVMERSDKNTAWKTKMEAEKKNAVDELKKIQQEIDELEGDVKLRTPGSSDYFRLVREGMEKEARLDAVKKYHQQDLSLKEQLHIEELYQDVIKAAQQVAEKMGLDVILTKDDLKTKATSLQDLTLMLRTNKVLYSSDQIDITAAVLEEMNKLD